MEAVAQSFALAAFLLLGTAALVRVSVLVDEVPVGPARVDGVASAAAGRFIPTRDGALKPCSFSMSSRTLCKSALEISSRAYFVPSNTKNLRAMFKTMSSRGNLFDSSDTGPNVFTRTQQTSFDCSFRMRSRERSTF